MSSFRNHISIKRLAKPISLVVRIANDHTMIVCSICGIESVTCYAADNADGKMAEVPSDSCRIHNSRSEKAVSSRSQPAAHRRYVPKRGPGSAPSEPQRGFRVRKDYLRRGGFPLSAICRWREAPQSQNSSVNPGRSYRVPDAAGGCFFPWREDRSRDMLSCAI